MFDRILSHMQLRHSTAFLLSRADDRLLDDIGLKRGDLEAMHLGIGTRHSVARVSAFPSGGALPVIA